MWKWKSPSGKVKVKDSLWQSESERLPLAKVKVKVKDSLWQSESESERLPLAKVKVKVKDSLWQSESESERLPLAKWKWKWVKFTDFLLAMWKWKTPSGKVKVKVKVFLWESESENESNLPTPLWQSNFPARVKLSLCFMNGQVNLQKSEQICISVSDSNSSRTVF